MSEQWVDHLEYPELTMYQMIQRTASMHAGETAYEFYSRHTNYAQFLKKIDRAAEAFRAAGVKEGDIVTLCMPNIPQALDAFYAIDKIGAAACMIHPLSAVGEIAFYLNDTKSGLILVPDLFYEKVEEALGEVGHPVRILVARLQDELPLHLKIAYVAAKGKSYLKFPNTGHAELWSKFLKKGDAAARARAFAGEDAAARGAVGAEASSMDAMSRDAVGAEASSMDAMSRDAVGAEAGSMDAMSRGAVGAEAGSMDAMSRGADGAEAGAAREAKREGGACVPFQKDRTSVILYSGGTSGKPKGICLSDYNMNALAIQCRSRIPYEFRPGLSMLSCMPIFHGFGLGVNIHTVLTHGAKCILMPTFTNETYADMLIKKKPNFIAGVPTIFEALLHMPQLEGKRLDYLLGMFCGGDSLSVELKRKVDAFLREHGSPIQVQEGYGLTECVTASCLTPHDRAKEGSIGLPFPDTKYAIVKPGTAEEMPAGEEGEIILSGPTVMLGYLGAPEETEQTLRVRDGEVWLYTGDLGKMDEEGYVYFRQRMKRMIITNGYNVYPGQLENVIDSCPEVACSCVIGVKDRRRGQRVRAYIVLREGLRPSEEVKERILSRLRQKIAKYAMPREVEFREELPKTLVGKVFYRRLEEEANAAEDERERAVI